MTVGNQKQYADHRGVTLRAVQKALDAGRIGPDAYDKIKAGSRWRYTIDFEKADQHWADRTDETFKRSPTRGEMANKPPPRRSLSAIEATRKRLALQEKAAALIGDDPLPEENQDETNPDTSANASLAQANAAKARVAAKMAELAYQEKIGNLLEKEMVFQVWSEIGTIVNENLSNIAARISGILAAESDEKKVFDILTHEHNVVKLYLADSKMNAKLVQAGDN